MPAERRACRESTRRVGHVASHWRNAKARSCARLRLRRHTWSGFFRYGTAHRCATGVDILDWIGEGRAAVVVSAMSAIGDLGDPNRVTVVSTSAGPQHASNPRLET